MKMKRKMKLVHLKDLRKRRKRKRTMMMKTNRAQNWEREKRKWASLT